MGERVPPEIKNFFNFLPGQSLLIKGNAGTGKTILALEILREICDKGNGVYISTRMEPRRLYEFSPWIKDFIPEQNVINGTQSRLASKLKLDEDKSRTFDYGKALDFFKTLFENTEEMENPVIVFDSWDGVLAHLHLEKEAARLTQGICDFCRDMEIHVIFVTEQKRQTTLDYIVDCVVTLHRSRLGKSSFYRTDNEHVEMRRIREIEINKTRGLLIKQPQYLFTLHEGRFRFFSPYKENLSVRTKPLPDKSEKLASTGIRELDEIMGGFPVGSFNLWEIGYGVNKCYEQMLLQVCMNMLEKNRGVIGIPPMGSFLMKKELENLLVHIPETNDVNIEISTFLSILQGNREKTGNPSFAIISVDSLENAFGSTKTVKFMDNIAKVSKETELLFSVLYLMRSESEISKIVTNAVDSHLMFQEADGALVLYGVRPVTGLFSVASEDERVRLIPIV